MIYLIDDNKPRQQKDFGWSEDRFSQYVHILTPLYSIEDVVEIGDKLYYDNNIILYHESFLDFTGDKGKAVEQRNKLTEKTATNNLLSVVFFSGSQSSRSLIKNTAYLPAGILYSNLEVLIQKYDQAKGSLKYLLFGENPDIEQELDKILSNENSKIEVEPAIIHGRNVFFRPNSRYIQNAIEGVKEVILFSSDVSDEKLSEKINEYLEQEEYDNIFIPLCFGQTLSDFNGLRLATHIRCSETFNQLKRIFIYSFVGIEFLLQNEYFNILKTKDVELVDYSKKAFQHVASRTQSSLNPYELSKEIKKLDLQPPKNYLDNHSIANEWAIHQWAKTIGCDETDELTKIFKNIETNLYFKYLRTINPISELDRIFLEKLIFKYEGKPKVLLIDDEADKGWNEIFAYLLTDLNGIYSDYLEVDFKKLSSDEIIYKSIDKIDEDDIDIVILDFRLNPSDFENKNSEEITSIKLLKKIKERNPGIQVIAFSATNKIWNFQAFQDLGVDGFVTKDLTENRNDSLYAAKSITDFTNLFKEVAKKIFLKEFFKQLFHVKDKLDLFDYEDGADFEHFLKELKSQINIIKEGARQLKANSSITFDVVFLNTYNFFEMMKNYYLKEQDFRFYIGIESIELYRYSYNNRNHSLSNNGIFVRNGQNDYPSWFQCIAGLLVDYFQIMNANDPYIKTLWKIKDWRNEYIHGNKPSFSRSELLKIVQLLAKITSSIKE